MTISTPLIDTDLSKKLYIKHIKLLYMCDIGHCVTIEGQGSFDTKESERVEYRYKASKKGGRENEIYASKFFLGSFKKPVFIVFTRQLTAQ